MAQPRSMLWGQGHMACLAPSTPHNLPAQANAPLWKGKKHQLPTHPTILALCQEHRQGRDFKELVPVPGLSNIPLLTHSLVTRPLHTPNCTAAEKWLVSKPCRGFTPSSSEKSLFARDQQKIKQLEVCFGCSDQKCPGHAPALQLEALKLHCERCFTPAVTPAVLICESQLTTASFMNR